MIEKIERLQQSVNRVPEKVSEVVRENQEVLLSLNRDQMLLGRDAEGNILTPGYLDDPYFDTPEQAETYANMKYRLEADSFLIGSTYPEARDIDSKYDGKVFGIAPASRDYFYRHYIHPALLRLLR